MEKRGRVGMGEEKHFLMKAKHLQRDRDVKVMLCLEKQERLGGSWARLGWSVVSEGWGALMSYILTRLCRNECVYLGNFDFFIIQ